MAIGTVFLCIIEHETVVLYYCFREITVSRWELMRWRGNDYFPATIPINQSWIRHLGFYNAWCFEGGGQCCICVDGTHMAASSIILHVK